MNKGKYIFVFLLLIGCNFNNSFKKDLLLINSSNKNICYYLTYSKVLEKQDIYNEYRDEYFLDLIWYFNIRRNDSIRPIHPVVRGSQTWRHNIKEYSPDSTLHLYIFPIDTVKKYSWQRVYDEKKYTQHKYRIKDLDSMNWKIVIK